MKRKKRIAVIGIRGFPFVQGGVESHCRQLIPRLTANYDFRVYRRKPYLTQKSSVEIEGVDFVDLRSSRIKGVEAVVHTLLCVAHLIFNRVDCVNVHNIGPGFFIPLLRLLGYPVVLTYHSANYEHSKWGPVSRRLLRLAERIALSCASYVIFVSPLQRARYSQRVLNKSVAIPNGITAQPKPASVRFLTELGCRPGKYILAVGRLTQEKGFETLIEAVQGMAEVEHLVIAGDSDHDPMAKVRLKALDREGKLLLPGYTTGWKLAELYANASLYVLSSFAEGFPIVLLEAMSFGLPIVASDIPASHIISLPEERYAVPGDADSFRTAIRRALISGPSRMEYDLREYDWDVICRRTAEVYEAVLTH